MHAFFAVLIEATVSTQNTKLAKQSMQSNIGYMNRRFKVIIMMYTHVRKFPMNVNYESPALRRRSKVCRSLMQGILSTKSTEESTDISISPTPYNKYVEGI